MTFKTKLIQVLIIFLVDVAIFLWLEHYIPSEVMRIFLISAMDVFAIHYLKPYFMPVFNLIFRILAMIGVRL